MHRSGIVAETARPWSRFVTMRHRALVTAGIVSLLLLVSMLVNAAVLG